MQDVEQCRVSQVGGEDLLGDMLTSVSTMSKTVRQHALSRSGLLPGQETVLGLLREETGRRICDLAQELHVQQSSISKTVSKLEEKRLCKRFFGSHDGRVVPVRLTSGGRELQLLVKDAYAGEAAEILRYIPAEDRALAIRGLRLLQEALEKRVSRIR